MDNAQRAIATREAPGWPSLLTIYGENGQVVCVDMTDRQVLHLVAQLLACLQVGQRE